LELPNLDSSSGKLRLPPGIGRAGEAAARVFVTQELGYKIAETNFRTREGEVDIVATDNGTWVFIEVKTRSNHGFGSGVEQISTRKAQRLQATAQRFLAENDLYEVNWRIDLLSIEMSRSGRVGNIEHIPSAIEDQG
jgi:putative endonuclease